jgi:hypothetical protein
MPPKKRKAAATAAAKISEQKPAKRVRVGDTSTIDTDSRPTTPVSGRPRRSTSNDQPQYNFNRRGSSNASDVNSTAKPTTVKDNVLPAPKRRGRPPKNTSKAQDSAPTASAHDIPRQSTSPDSAGPKRRGRPRKAKTTNDGPSPPVPAKTKPGRKPKAQVPVAQAEAAGSEGEDHNINDDSQVNGTNLTNHAELKIDPDIQYWLMKAEPDSRIEKGVDVKFSIDDLAARTEPEGWDGKLP